MNNIVTSHIHWQKAPESAPGSRQSLSVSTEARKGKVHNDNTQCPHSDGLHK